MSLFYISQQRIVKYRSATATIYALPPCPSSIDRSRKVTQGYKIFGRIGNIYATEKLYRMKASKRISRTPYNSELRQLEIYF